MSNPNISEPEVLYYGATGTEVISGPTKKLEQNPFKQSSFSYPRNLGSSTRKHVIEFVTMVPKPGYTQTGTAIDDAGKLFKEAYPAASETIQKILDGDKEGAIKEVVKFSSTAGNVFKTLSSADVNRVPGTTIRLYVPDTVNVTYSAGYDAISLTGILGRPYFIAQAGVSLFDKYKNSSGDFDVQKAINAVGDDPYLRQIIGKLPVFNPGTAELLTAAVGQALNPQMQVIFSTIGFREHQFDFTLTPYSKEEAVAIKNIVKEFKLAAAPRIQAASVFDEGLFFKVPDRFKIRFLYGDGTENRNVHRITECVLKNIAVDYAPMGWVTFDDGNPVQTKLTLQFQEVEIVDKTRIEEGY